MSDVKKKYHSLFSAVLLDPVYTWTIEMYRNELRLKNEAKNPFRVHCWIPKWVGSGDTDLKGSHFSSIGLDDKSLLEVTWGQCRSMILCCSIVRGKKKKEKAAINTEPEVLLPKFSLF